VTHEESPRPAQGRARGVAARESGDVVPLGEATRLWAAISLQTFGGPAGQIAVLQHHLVDRKRWIGQRRFLHALNYCMMLPGPEAQQLAVYIGWLLNGIRGGLIAGWFFVLPGVVALLGLSAVYVAYGDTVAVSAVFAGLGPAVIVIVAQALWRVSKRALTRRSLIFASVGAFVALALFGVPFPIVIGAAALYGLVLHRWAPAPARPADDGDAGPAPLISDDTLHHAVPNGRRAAAVIGIGLLLWAAPIVAFAALTGPSSIFTQQGLFFSGAAVVTFGGAYAVLTYIAQQAVENYAWLAAGDMVRGLALAESTPGPLIMVVQFVAFVGAWNNPGDLDPWVAAILASLLVTWVTFVPCFIFIFLGAPYIERLRGNRAVSAALSGVTAAVVGVIANLAVYFAVHTLFTATHDVAWGPFQAVVPDLATIRIVPMVITAVAAVLVFWLKLPMLRVLGICAVLGLATAWIPQAV
jgi:chromate transporter